MSPPRARCLRKGRFRRKTLKTYQRETVSLPTEFRHNIAFYEANPAQPKDGFTYLLLHGLGNSLDFWVEVAPVLAQSRRTIAIDIPGFGRSPTPANGFSLEHISEAINAFSDAIDITESVLVAHSLGTFIALQMAAQQPLRFKRLILVDGTLMRATQLIQDPKRILTNPGLAVYVSAQFIGGLFPIRRPTANLISHTRVIRDITLWPYVANPDSVNPDVLAAALSDNGGWNVLRVLGESHSIKLEAMMSAVTQPVDLAWGAKDHLINYVDIQQARGHMRVHRALEISDCGHWPMVEKPSNLTEFLLSFDGS